MKYYFVEFLEYYPYVIVEEVSQAFYVNPEDADEFCHANDDLGYTVLNEDEFDQMKESFKNIINTK